MKKTTLLVNSDFGMGHTIGFRTTPIAKLLHKNNSLDRIICRDYKKGILAEKFFFKPIPFGCFFPKLLTGVYVYISKRFPSRRIQVWLFEKFSKRYIKDVEIIHSWEFTPCLYKMIKKKNARAVIIQDVPIGLNSFANDINKNDKIFPKYEENVPKEMIEGIEMADFIVAPSHFVRDTILKQGIKGKKIFIVPFGVDIEKFKPIKKKRSLKFTAAFAGNITNRKGIKYLIQAWKELVDENKIKDAELYLYGRVYPDVKKYLKSAEKYGIKTPGFVDVSKELLKADIYVFPSLLEGSAKAVYEAMACGLPVITTYNSGSIIEDGKQGFVIPIQDVGSIKEKIMFFYDNPDKRVKMGQLARELAEKYTWENYANNIINIYKSV